MAGSTRNQVVMRLAQPEARMERVRVMIADKQAFFRDGLRRALSQESDLELIDCDPTHNLIEAVEDQSPDVLLLGIDYPALSGLRLSKKVVRRSPKTGVVMLSPNPTDEELVEVVKSGASAYLSKNTSIKELIETIREVLRGEYPIDGILAATLDVTEQVLRGFRDVALLGRVAHALVTPLTYRETQILDCIARGKSNKQTGQALQISEQTVKSHVSIILRKLNATHRAHAVALAMRSGWIGNEEKLPMRSRPEVRSH